VNLEEVSVPVRAGDVYRLWVDNFTNRATSFTITNTVNAGAVIAPSSATAPALHPQ
jgi:hypothetical protein